MGKLIDGVWQKQSIITSDKSGKYDRIPRSFREQISPDHPKFKPEKDRYHLYVSYACPWAHRTLIFRELKKLKDMISISVVHPYLMENGWSFDQNFEEATGDSVEQKEYLYEIYQMADTKVTTSVTVPVLWDKKEKTIVNNESSEIIRIFNSAFNEITGDQQDFYPLKLKDKIDAMNDQTYESVNNGVYKSGFAKSQQAYDEAVTTLFDELDRLDAHLEQNTYLLGDTFTEADVRLITTLLRFDLVYYVHFKCSHKKISEYKNLSRYAELLYKMPAIKNTTNFEHIKHHYYYSHKEINPYRLIPYIPAPF